MSTQLPAEHRFLLLHGWQNRRPAGHWQRWLAERLTGLGHQVDYPQLPDPDDPDLDRWLDELRPRLGTLAGPGFTVICHSLSCALWLHAVSRELITSPVDRVLLVSPPSPSVLEQHAEVAAFAPPPVTKAQLMAASPDTMVVAGDHDPYCPEGAGPVYGQPLGLPVEMVRNGGHLTLDEGYGPWPWILDWCVGA